MGMPRFPEFIEYWPNFPCWRGHALIRYWSLCKSDFYDIIFEYSELGRDMRYKMLDDSVPLTT